MPSRPRIEDPFSKSGVLFFKVPITFHTHQSSLTQSEKDIYMALISQVHYKKSLLIEMPLEGFMYWTGIKKNHTITKAVKGLAEKGWLHDVIYQMQKPNIYVVNIIPKANPDLLEKLAQRTENTSRAKKISIAGGEAGKFKKTKRKKKNV